MFSSPIIYLDTQDYSRFGDVLRGRSDTKTEKIFRELERRKLSGEAIFAISMPILGELFQYDANYRETTIKKAEAVELLSGEWALAYPSRLIASEIAEYAKKRGLISFVDGKGVVSSSRYWYPNMAGYLNSFRQELNNEINSKLAEYQLPSRALRRKAASNARRIDPAEIVQRAAPEMAMRLGISEKSIKESLLLLLKRRISPDAASQRLLGEIAEPTKFVEIYFERVETDRSMPDWIKKTGNDLFEKFSDFRTKLLPLIEQGLDIPDFKEYIRSGSEKAARTLAITMADDDVVEFGISDNLWQNMKMIQDFDIPMCEIFSSIFSSYIQQITGMSGSNANIERSFAGDMVHSWYLPHVDIWRGDRRFSALLKTELPRYANRIVPLLQDLPTAIDDWHRRRARP